VSDLGFEGRIEFRRLVLGAGVARFEIAIWNPERAWFNDEELTPIGEALGHPVRQVRAHI
jgi:hypothetical protein